MKKKYTMNDLIEIENRLFAKDGCPWDKSQTYLSLRKDLLEECYEVIDSATNNDIEGIKEEIGDIMQVAFLYANVATQKGDFTLDDVTDVISRKMINRHRHIFNKTEEMSVSQIENSWDEIKKEEKNYKSNNHMLNLIPKTMPSVLRAEKVSSKINKIKGDKPNIENDINNIKNILYNIDNNKHIDENSLGELLYNCAKLSKFCNTSSEIALNNFIDIKIGEIID